MSGEKSQHIENEIKKALKESDDILNSVKSEVIEGDVSNEYKKEVKNELVKYIENLDRLLISTGYRK